jgi:hypothetical protein
MFRSFGRISHLGAFERRVHVRAFAAFARRILVRAFAGATPALGATTGTLR